MNKQKLIGIFKRSIKKEKCQKLLAQNKIVVFDIRLAHDFEQGHLPNSINLDPVVLKDNILKINRNQKIAIYHYSPKSWFFIATWARKRGFKKVRIII